MGGAPLPGAAAPEAPSGPQRRRVGPRDALERSVRKIWSEVLGHREFGVQDNFFELGGASLAMVRVQLLIRDLCGYELPLAALFAAPTIAGTAVLLRGSARPDPGPLVPLSPDGAGPPLLCFHPVGGSAAVYFPLALSMPERPVYGLQALGLTTGTAPQATMAELVETYLAAIRAVAPSGPYHLLGYSLGGIVAFAVAHEIRARHGETPTVILVDTPASTRLGPAEPYLAVGSYALNLDLDYDQIVPSGRDQAIETIYQEARRAGVFGTAFPIDRLASIFDTALANARAAHDYPLRWYDGEVVLVQSGSAPDSADWQPYAAKVTCYTVPLPHAVMLEEKSARRISAILSAHFAAAAPTERPA
jgi:thioesterase domain-containing protein/aryl carrier-like protein